MTTEPSPPTPERWRAIRAVLEAALDLDRSARGAFLERACAGDPALRAAVDSLLAREAATEPRGDTAFLEPPFRAAAPRVASLFAAAARVGERIGAYRIADVIGVGGMGAVYRATRDDDAFEREVAVKLVRRELSEGAEALAAFHRERRLLASLDHPGISRLLDGGEAADGSPYIVMEFVRGRAIDVHCDAESLPLDERLALFRDVCAAAHHAHRSLVVHRDLKPANVLVTEGGAVKLIDFGVASLFSRDAALLAMTPRYASPEVRRGDARVTTAADVYSLGVLLADLAGATAPADVVSIARKASDEDPSRRYSSAAELSEDVARFLGGLPVEAARPSAARRLALFAARHGTAVSLAALAFLLVAAFAVTAAVLAHRLAGEKASAIEARRVAERVAAFLGDTFAVASPKRLGADAKVLEALADAGSRVDSELAASPAVASGVHAAIGRTYAGLGFGALAEPHLRAAWRLAAEAYGDASAETAAAMERLATTLAYLDREESVALMEGALARIRAAAGDGDPRVASYVHGLAFALYRGAKPPRFAEAEARIEEAIRLYRARAGGSDDGNVARACHMFAAMRLRSGRAEESDALYRRALETFERAGQGSEPHVVDCRIDHAICLVRLKRFDEARDALLASTEPLRRAYGEPGAVSVLAALSELELERGDAAAAERLAREGFARLAALFAPDVDVASLPDAEALARLAPRAEAAERAETGYSGVLSALGSALSASGRDEAAVPVLEEALRLRESTLAPRDWRTACARSELGKALVGVGERATGIGLLERALADLRRSLGDAHWETEAAARRLREAGRE